MVGGRLAAADSAVLAAIVEMDGDTVANIWPDDTRDLKLHKSDFAIRLLVQIGKIDVGDVHDACEVFDRLAKVASHDDAGGKHFLTADTAAAAVLRVNRSASGSVSGRSTANLV